MHIDIRVNKFTIGFADSRISVNVNQRIFRKFKPQSKKSESRRGILETERFLSTHFRMGCSTFKWLCRAKSAISGKSGRSA